MAERIQRLLTELKAGLSELYGPRLKGVYLYGSYARREQEAESDVDVLLVLDRVDDYCGEINRTGYLASELSLKYDVSISRVLVASDERASGDTPFLTNVRADAIPA